MTIQTIQTIKEMVTNSKKKLDVDELKSQGSILSQFYDDEQAKKLIYDFNKKVDKIKKLRDQEAYQKRFQKHKEQQELEQSLSSSSSNNANGEKLYFHIEKNKYNYKFKNLNDSDYRIESQQYTCNVCSRKIFFDQRFLHKRTDKQIALESPYKEGYSKPRVHYCEPTLKIFYDPIMSEISPREDVIGHLLEFQDFDHCRVCRNKDNILWLHMFLQNNPNHRKW